MIDITDMLPGSASLAFNAGTPTVTDGTYSGAIVMTGSDQVSNFAFAADHSGGTAITFKSYPAPPRRTRLILPETRS